MSYHRQQNNIDSGNNLSQSSSGAKVKAINPNFSTSYSGTTLRADPKDSKTVTSEINKAPEKPNIDRAQHETSRQEKMRAESLFQENKAKRKALEREITQKRWVTRKHEEALQINKSIDKKNQKLKKEEETSKFYEMARKADNRRSLLNRLEGGNLSQSKLVWVLENADNLGFSQIEKEDFENALKSYKHYA